MKKLRLDVDSLRVESFTPREPAAETGTVRAHETWQSDCPCEPDLSIDPCGPAPTAAATCGYTCGYTCGCYTPTRVGWTCDPYASECLPVPEQ
ncbi:MAG TPA: hypothetical protein VFJ16_09595 [Longimicrobium sp.]|nr:hypothetical protein [Longimicrobium sp.]